MEIRIEIPVYLEENVRPAYFENKLKEIDAVHEVRLDYNNSFVNITADISSQSEAKTVLKSLNRISGTKYVSDWKLL